MLTLQLCAACPNLEVLRIRGCFMLSDLSLQAIARHLRKLKVGWITDARPTWTHFLQLLNIQGLKRLKDGSFDALSTACTSLEDLDMQSCSSILTAKAFTTVAQGLTSLRSLNLKRCPPVDDSILQCIGSSLGTFYLLPSGKFSLNLFCFSCQPKR